LKGKERVTVFLPTEISTGVERKLLAALRVKRTGYSVDIDHQYH